ncbi:TPA: oxidoreductase [Burkholderia aenigmatica]|uniref:PDR/VanB family oxidoreductase n=1 Tax=Burkholderia sp. AU45251 TaxID=3059204 RepID=UPI0026550AAA|nr:PDR/VanB family oxidoreductase [Burkholderia sp. AU45251]HDR9484674.1 oxidoreductase [Burkholderia aenigmatica]MDN7516728.1 PDR/VanB family oxidoreductase [Burkholderia sp. AU45251]HDR9515950.1 oxidoreductase [Burkholderia aenigmatica]HDR9592759.1 oxidoreductase [Burkholderia aenigmatica]HDR9599739.1 oxidoreductase [Burkholderia aenigmatica]
MRDPAIPRAIAEWRPIRLVDRYRLAEHVFAVTLANECGMPLPESAPGDHIEVQVPGGTRAYSLCNPPGARDHYLLGIHHSTSRGVAHYLCDTCRIGDTVQVRGPGNRFALLPTHRRVVLIAGGIGITPIISMAEHLALRGVDFDMHYCARSRAAAAFVDRLDGSAYRDRVRYHFRDDPRCERLDLDALFKSLDVTRNVYLCGPNAMLAEARALSERYSLSDRLHYERFGASRPASDPPAPTGGFDVWVARSGRRVEVPADCSIAVALNRAGVDVPLSCEQGVCGMCVTRVLDGIPDHRDAVLSDAERAANDVILPCVSRAKSASLTLDL